ncbi:Gar1/Naf1 RNA binding region-domain-containing protein [Morchella snyderi]|nr:Gar1/Naf1 RNA binding region-domain-containing protein [Morchella snyderi]
MSRGGFRGGRGGGDRGGRGGSFGGGGFRGGRTGFQAPTGPPDTVLEMGKFMHACEGEIVCQSINTKIPYFNAPIYLENKSVIGKVDEILGPMNQVYFTIKPQDGIVASSFKEGDKFYIGGDKLLPLDRFLPKPKAVGPRGPKPAGGRGGSRGGRGAPRGGRGAPRGGSRGGFTPRGGRGGFTPRGGSRGGSGGFTPRGGSRGGFTPRGRGRGSY